MSWSRQYEYEGIGFVVGRLFSPYIGFLVTPEITEAIKNKEERALELLSLMGEKADELITIGDLSESFSHYSKNLELDEFEAGLKVIINSDLAWDDDKEEAGEWLGWVQVERQKRAERQRTSKPLPQVDRQGYIYLIKADTGQYKIGRTKKVNQRMGFFGVKLPFDFDLIHSFPADDMYMAESKLHQVHSVSRVNGEWFDLNPDQVQEIKEIYNYENGRFVAG